jgi:SAM-dependent methyltransferase
MPSSRPNVIPTVIHLLRQLKPRSILDVGVGFGKWGHLFREYTDILESELDPARYQRSHWQVRIDGIEGHAAYLTDMHRFLYNHIHVGEAGAVLGTLGHYDLIFLGDVIEHFEKDAGRALLREAQARADQAVVITTPKFETEQEDLCGNELERHRSLWNEDDFRAFPGGQVVTVDEATWLAVLPGPRAPKAPLALTPPRPPVPEAATRARHVREALTASIPLETPFVLIDEEQLRHTLPHHHTLPFLERDGAYWGPPADDATALAELERMRRAGARYVVLVWSTFWWLQHYTGFARRLREQGRVVREDGNLLVLELPSPS